MRAAQNKIEALKYSLSDLKIKNATAELNEMAAGMIQQIGGAGDTLGRLTEMVEEDRQRAAGRARVAQDSLDTSDFAMKEAEQKALADQALADFAAKEGIAVDPAHARAPHTESTPENDGAGEPVAVSLTRAKRRRNQGRDASPRRSLIAPQDKRHSGAASTQPRNQGSPRRGIPTLLTTPLTRSIPVSSMTAPADPRRCRLPAWAAEMIALYQSHAASQFLLSGNVNDRFLLPLGGGGNRRSAG